MEIRLNATSIHPSQNISQAEIPSQADSPPNVVFISIDDLNDWVGVLDGYVDVKTPNIDRLASQGMLFKNAHTPVPVCNAARTAAMTGLQPDTTKVFDNGQDWRNTVSESETLPAYFRDNGYQSIGAGKLFHIQESSVFDQYFQASGAQIPDVSKGRFGSATLDQPQSVYRDVQVAEFASDYLSQDHQAPFFLGVGFSRPHIPLTAPQEFFDLYPLDQIQLPNVENLDDLADIPRIGQQLAGKLHQSILDTGDWAEIVQAYLANISFVDAQVGKVIDALEHNGLSDKTVVALWSDHGWHLGEKLHWQKRTLWEEATRVPLIVSAPGITEPGSTTDAPVSLVDLFPTLVDLTGIPEKSNVEGHSLTPLLRNPEATWNHSVVSTWDNSYAVRTQRWRYIRYWDGTEELYDHHHDPNELHNLAEDAAVSLTKAELSQELDSYFAKYAPERLPGDTSDQIIHGDESDNIITGSPQNDTILGGGGNDTLFGGGGQNQLEGGSGNDFITHISRKSGILAGNSGNDTLVGGEGDDTLDGGIGDDILEGRGGRNTYLINSEGDRILSHSDELGSSIITSVNWALPAGFTRLSLEKKAKIGRGNVRNNQIFGNQQDNILFGERGKDRLFGDEGNDSLFGGVGNDRLFGGAGDDILDGSDGIDIVKTSQDNDFHLTNDALVGEGKDTLIDIETVFIMGGESDNSLDASAFSNGSVHLRGRKGNDTLVGGAHNDILNGGSGFDTVRLQSRRNVIRASDSRIIGNGRDLLKSIEHIELTGHQGDNILDASQFEGSSHLQGEDGNDTLIPSLGDSRLVGGEGADTFSLTRLKGDNITILDFDRLEGDVIAIAGNLLGAEFKRINTIAPEQLGIGDTWGTPTQRFLFDSDNSLWFDRDGPGEAPGRRMVQFATNTTLTASDFSII